MKQQSSVELIRALRHFKESYNELNKTWTTHTTDDLDDTEAIRFYPFHQSFDVLSVNKWIDETFEELGANLTAETMVYNPKCSDCPMHPDSGECESNYRSCKDAPCYPESSCKVPFNRDNIIEAIKKFDSVVFSDSASAESDQDHAAIVDLGYECVDELTNRELYDAYNEICFYTNE